MAIQPREIGALDQAIQVQLDLIRHSRSVEGETLKLIEQMRKELLSRLAGEDLTAWGRARLNALLKDTKSVIDGYYAAIQASIQPSLLGVAETASAQMLPQGLAVALAATVPSSTILETLVKNALIEGAPSAQWWSKMSLDTSFRFAATLRQGIAQGETITQMYRRVNDVTDLAGRNSRALVHTSVMQVAGDARELTITRNTDIYSGFRHLSTLDGHTTPVCTARSGLEWDLEKKPIGHSVAYKAPPIHWGCRSVLMGILRPMSEFGLNEPTGMTRSSAEGQIARETTFDSFLKRRTIAQQDEQLGVGKAQLWRDGTITLRQLIDNKGNELTLAQLRRKYQ